MPRPLSPPFLAPGGGRRHADFVLGALPEHFGAYVEPFVDGGGVALAVMEQFPQTTFRLSSQNAELVNTWQVLQSDTRSLVSAVVAHRERHDDGRVARLAAFDAEALAAWSAVDRAARFVYLRGSSGRETVAFDEANVRRVGELLAERDVRFDVQPLFSVVGRIGENDLVYLDPATADPVPADPATADPATADPAPPVGARELRSFVGTVTARAAFLLAVAPASAGTLYAGWNTMTVLADRGDGDVLWANRTLERARRR